MAFAALWRKGIADRAGRVLDASHAVWIAVGFGIGLRLLLVFCFPHLDDGSILDSGRYVKTAHYILAGRGFTEYGNRPSAYVPPLYPYFLAGVFKLAGFHGWVVKVIQCVLGGFLAWIVCAMGKRLFHPRAGVLAAFFTAVFPDFVALPSFLYAETVYIFINTLAFHFLIKGYAEPRRRSPWLVSGIFLGLGILTRHVLLLFPAFVCAVSLLVRSQRKYLKPLLVWTAICILTLVPWTIRNYMCFQRIVPVASGFGGSFWVGSDPGQKGQFQYFQSEKKIQEESGGEMDATRRENLLVRHGLRNILSRPGEYFGLVSRKMFRYFFQVYGNVPDGTPRRARWVIAAGLGAAYYPILALFVTGIWVFRKSWSRLFILYGVVVYSALAYSMLLVVPRYRMPLIPFFILLASATLSAWLWNRDPTTGSGR